jgi:hypothetical protein
MSKRTLAAVSEMPLSTRPPIATLALDFVLNDADGTLIVTTRTSGIVTADFVEAAFVVLQNKLAEAYAREAITKAKVKG